MQQKSELPEGWKSVSLGELVQPSKEKIEPSENPNLKYVGLEHIESHKCQIKGYGFSVDIKSTKTMFHRGDVLYGKLRPYLNKVCVPNFDGVCSTDILVFNATSNLNNYYLMRFLSTPNVVDYASNNSSGVQLPRINFQKLSSYTVPLPPLSEQHRIVSAIEALFARLDATNDKLDSVLETLKRFRQSVLVAACEGKLVPRESKLAQEEGRDYESAEALLKRILYERKEKTHFNSKQIYEEPQEPDTSSLRELPAGWVWTSMYQLLVGILAGKSFKCEERPPNENEVGVVKVSSVTWGEFDEKESKTCQSPDKIREEYYIKEGDFLFSRANTIELIGACVIVKQISKKLMLSDKILRFNFAIVPAEWVLINLRSLYGRSEIEHLATGNQKSMRNIGQDRIRQIRIPLPPLSEQYEIIRRVDALFAFASSIEAKVAAAREKTEKLRQSILAKAFSGELVETEAEIARREGRDYETAEVLIERIKEERGKGGRNDET